MGEARKIVDLVREPTWRRYRNVIGTSDLRGWSGRRDGQGAVARPVVLRWLIRLSLTIVGVLCGLALAAQPAQADLSDATPLGGAAKKVAEDVSEATAAAKKPATKVKAPKVEASVKKAPVAKAKPAAKPAPKPAAQPKVAHKVPQVKAPAVKTKPVARPKAEAPKVVAPKVAKAKAKVAAKVDIQPAVTPKVAKAKVAAKADIQPAVTPKVKVPVKAAVKVTVKPEVVKPKVVAPVRVEVKVDAEPAVTPKVKVPVKAEVKVDARAAVTSKVTLPAIEVPPAQLPVDGRPAIDLPVVALPTEPCRRTPCRPLGGRRWTFRPSSCRRSRSLVRLCRPWMSVRFRRPCCGCPESRLDPPPRPRLARSSSCRRARPILPSTAAGCLLGPAGGTGHRTA